MAAAFSNYTKALERWHSNSSIKCLFSHLKTHSYRLLRKVQVELHSLLWVLYCYCYLLLLRIVLQDFYSLHSTANSLRLQAKFETHHLVKILSVKLLEVGLGYEVRWMKNGKRKSYAANPYRSSYYNSSLF